MKPAYLLLFYTFGILTFIPQAHSADDSPPKRSTRFWLQEYPSSPESSPHKSAPDSQNVSPEKSTYTPESFSPGTSFAGLQLGSPDPDANFQSVLDALAQPGALTPGVSFHTAQVARKAPPASPRNRPTAEQLLKTKLARTPNPDPETLELHNLFNVLRNRHNVPTPHIAEIKHITAGNALGGGHLPAALEQTHDIYPEFTNPTTGVTCARITPKPGHTGHTKNSTLFPPQFSASDIEKLISNIHENPESNIARKTTAPTREKILARDPQTGLMVVGFVDNKFEYRTLYPVLFYGSEEESDLLTRLAVLFQKSIIDIQELIEAAKLNPEFILPENNGAIVNIGPAISANCGDVLVKTAAVDIKPPQVPQVRRFNIKNLGLA